MCTKCERLEMQERTLLKIQNGRNVHEVGNIRALIMTYTILCKETEGRSEGCRDAIYKKIIKTSNDFITKHFTNLS
jgi:hypothetical protein